MSWLLAVLATLASGPGDLLEADPDRVELSCFAHRGPVLAVASGPSGRAELTAGAVRVGANLLTRCSGLPGAHPTSLTWWGPRLAIGFRDVGVHLWDGERFEPVRGLGPGPVRAVAASADVLWVGKGADGLWKVAEGREARRFGHWLLGRRGITALAVDGDGALQVGVDPRGWWQVSASGQVSRRQSGVAIGCFVRTQVGDLRGHSPGLDCLDREVADWPGPALPFSHVTALASHRGALWAGTFDRGLFRVEGDTAEPVAGAPRFVNALLPVGTDLYVASPIGLYRVDLSGRARQVVLGLPSEHVNGLWWGRDETLWLATGAGLVGWRHGVVRIIDLRAGLPSQIVYAVTETSDGAVWAGTAAGVVRLSGAAPVVYTQAGGQLPHDWVTSLTPVGDDVLAGTYDAGVVRLSASGRVRRIAGLETAWINPHGVLRTGALTVAATLGDGLLVAGGHSSRRIGPLPSDDVTAVLFHRGELWIGTRGGLARLRARTGVRAR